MGETINFKTQNSRKKTCNLIARQNELIDSLVTQLILVCS
uniref:Uncharacterized protein n=1 Tax=Rhizophora mucronata TaxID=61149 RepID=A0A2P2Q9D7_RHIMU